MPNAFVTRGKRLFVLPVLLATVFGFHLLIRGIAPAEAQNDLPAIMFVTQPPFGSDFITLNAVFGNHQPRTGLAPRGGDLWIRSCFKFCNRCFKKVCVFNKQKSM